MSRFFRTSRVIGWFALTGATFSFMVLASFYLYLRPGLPAVDQLTDIRLQTPLRVYSADNRLIAEFGEKRRAPVTIEDIPEVQLQAFLAAEDANFYNHFGVDFRGLTRAAIELVTTGEIQSGGSTITMQVAKNYFLSRDRTFIRKFNEILLALQIERELPKERIMELYLNKIYLGNRAYGIESAAQVYYGKTVTELNLAQMAMLATLPKAPSAYNPIANPERAVIRRDWILRRMLALGFIEEEQYQEAVESRVTATYNVPTTEVDADYVAEMARAEMVARYGDSAYTDGFRVTLTVDSERQQAATQALRNGLEAYDRRHGFRGAIDTIDLDGFDRPEAADSETRVSTRDDYPELNRALASYPRLEELYPVVVTDVDDDNVTVYSRHLGEADMPFSTMTWAKPYRTENVVGDEPASPADVVETGDVVYVKRQRSLDSAASTSEDPAEQAREILGDGDQLAVVPRLTVALAQAPRIQGALISLNAKNGGIQALAGGYSFSQTKYNRALQARRQPGSTFKPFLYLAALEQGMTPATQFNDAPIVFDDLDLETTWRPQNSSGQFYGPTRLREALYRSRNLVSIRLLRDVGIDNTIDYLDQLGINTDNMQKDLSLALGSGNLTPMEVARGFAVIANGGHDVQPYLIQTIRNSRDEVLYEAPSVILCDDRCDELELQSPSPTVGFPALKTAPRLADERAVYILHSMLRDVVSRGTGRRALELGRDDIGGKTGTTNEQRDTWFAGFNYDIATIAWAGFDQPEPLGRREFGATVALPIWLDYMKVAMDDQPGSFMPQPNGIVSIRIDPETGQRARPGESNAMFELFREEDAPAELAEERGNRSRSDDDDDSDSNLGQDIF